MCFFPFPEVREKEVLTAVFGSNNCVGESVLRLAHGLMMTPLIPAPPTAHFLVSQGTDHHWFDSDAMEHQIGSLVENAVSPPRE